MSLTASDFLLLLNCYIVVIQNIGKRGPIFGFYGKTPYMDLERIHYKTFQSWTYASIYSKF